MKSYESFSCASGMIRRWLMPSSITVGLTFGPCQLAIADRAEQSSLTPFVFGLSEAAAHVEYSAGVAGIWVELTSLGAAVLFGVPGAVLRDKLLPLSDFLGEDTEHLIAAALTADDWATSCTVLDRFLLNRIARRATKVPPEAVLAWHHITLSGGRISIGAITDELGCSRRHLAQRFSEVFGITPKSFGKIVRFERAFDTLLSGRETLSAIALDCGYYDQAHFNRDMKAIIGTCPTEVLSARRNHGLGRKQAGVQTRSLT